MVWQRILKVSFLLLGLVILYISISRASLEMMISDEKKNNLRKIPIETEMINRDGNWEKISYKFPETRTLPSSPFYFIKKIRNYLWISFTKNSNNKGQILLLLADKNIEEVILMSDQKADKQIIIKTTIEAIDKLKLASTELKKDQSNQIENQQIQTQINQATYVYKKIIESLQIEEKEKEQLTKRLEEVY
ncbi:MAG: DUF5667 domain-containing protein [Candidatus Shapirobacteria bacterium]|nr:DUF5667 domain-containing protein [Candidatus Shapirobacteria bacterium]